MKSKNRNFNPDLVSDFANQRDPVNRSQEHMPDFIQEFLHLDTLSFTKIFKIKAK